MVQPIAGRMGWRWWHCMPWRNLSDAKSRRGQAARPHTILDEAIWKPHGSTYARRCPSALVKTDCTCTHEVICRGEIPIQSSLRHPLSRRWVSPSRSYVCGLSVLISICQININNLYIKHYYEVFYKIQCNGTTGMRRDEHERQCPDTRECLWLRQQQPGLGSRHSRRLGKSDQRRYQWTWDSTGWRGPHVGRWS